MENLSEKVYECTLAVEAHMICDLLSQAGISARIEGEFLQTGAGELPLGNLVKVRVDPARAAEAREVIADWEKLQPPDPAPRPVARAPAVKSLLWFASGAAVAGVGMLIALRTPASYDSVDYDGDGRHDIQYYYNGSAIARIDYDRDDDGKVDARWIFDINGVESEYHADDDFDGRFEWRGDVAEGEVTRKVLDADDDGNPEQLSQFRNGVITAQEFYLAGGGRIVKRELYDAGLLASAEFDDDGDGVFERRVPYDAHAEPRK